MEPKEPREDMIPYSKELLDEGKKYYGKIIITAEGVTYCDFDGNSIEEVCEPPPLPKCIDQY